MMPVNSASRASTKNRPKLGNTLLGLRLDVRSVASAARLAPADSMT
jgi:hypothetical protein